MNKPKFTPGPWNCIEGKTLIHIETDIGNPIGAGIPICSLPKSKRHNAYLLYALPDLYEALELAINTVECASIKEGVDLPWYTAAITALKKARGE